MIAGIDVRAVARDCWTALGHVADEFFGERRLFKAELPALILRRRRPRRWRFLGSDGEYTKIMPARGTSGYARGHSSVTLLVDPASCDLAEIRTLVVHELAHCMHACLRSNRADRTLDGPHGDTFNRLMVGAAVRLWGVVVGIGRPGYTATNAPAPARRRCTAGRPSASGHLRRLAALEHATHAHGRQLSMSRVTRKP